MNLEHTRRVIGRPLTAAVLLASAVATQAAPGTAPREYTAVAPAA